MRMISLYTPKIVIKSIMRTNISLGISVLAHEGKYMVTVLIPRYLFDQKTYVLPLFFICVHFYEY